MIRAVCLLKTMGWRFMLAAVLRALGWCAAHLVPLELRGQGGATWSQAIG